MNKFRLSIILLAPVLLAALFRFSQLELRPMHSDEAVHADKFGTLLEEGRYEYDPEEYHGPTLYYLTLLTAKLQGASAYVDLTEATLRIVPAVFGVALVAALGLLLPFLGAGAVAAAATLTAISPGMVFYSRYYIHEQLLVFFSFGALLAACHYVRRPGAWPAVLTGAFAGLTHATKETAPIALGSMALALLLTWLWERREGRTDLSLAALARGRHVLLALLSAAIVSFLLFSSFLTHPGGVVDSFRSYGIYLSRAGGNSLHAHPWNYYLDLLLYFPARESPIWTEGLIVALSILGVVSAFRPRNPENKESPDPRLLRFLSWYTLLMVLIYAAIPYKTPWCLLGFLHGMILLAGGGAVWLYRSLRAAPLRIAVSVLLVSASLHLGWQSYAGNFGFECDPRNPYVYAHTGGDVVQIVRSVEAVARSHPMGLSMPVEIISRENLWPLPWYLRHLGDVRWWNGVSDTTPAAPVILISPEMEPALIRKLYELPPPGEKELYMNMFDRYVELRPQVELRGYAAKKAWDDFRRMETNGSNPASTEP